MAKTYDSFLLVHQIKGRNLRQIATERPSGDILPELAFVELKSAATKLVLDIVALPYAKHFADRDDIWNLPEQTRQEGAAASTVSSYKENFGPSTSECP